MSIHQIRSEETSRLLEARELRHHEQDPIQALSPRHKELVAKHLLPADDDDTEPVKTYQWLLIISGGACYMGGLCYLVYQVYRIPISFLLRVGRKCELKQFGIPISLSLVCLKFIIRFIKKKRHQKKLNAYKDPTSFSKWLESHQGTPSKDSQRALLEQLYQRSITTPQPAIPSAQSPSSRTRNLVDFDRGISVRWLKDEFFKFPFMKRCISYGCELWFLRDVILCNFLTDQGFHDRSLLDWAQHQALLQRRPQTPRTAVVAKANRFVSYTGAYKISTFVHGLENMGDETYIWFDLFNVNQFMWRDKFDPYAIKERSNFSSLLAEAIRTIGSTTLLLERWDSIEAIHKIWVLWEVFLTIDSDGSLDLRAPPQTEETFVLWLEQHVLPQVHGTVKSIDVMQATSSKEEDRIAIIQHIETSTKGIDHVNKTVKTCLYEWYKTTTRAATVASDFRFALRDKQFERFVAELYLGQGMLSEARAALVSCLYPKVNGRRFRKAHLKKFYIPALCELSNVNLQLGDLDEAARVASRAIELGKTSHIGHSEEVNQARYLLGSLQMLMGRLELAEKSLQECVAQNVDRYDLNHRSSITAMKLLAEVHMLKHGDNTALAYVLLSFVHDVAVRSLGENDLLTTDIDQSLALCLAIKPESRGGAITMLESVHSQFSNLLGERHPKTLRSKQYLESALKVDAETSFSLFMMKKTLQEMLKTDNSHRLARPDWGAKSWNCSTCS